MDIDRVNYLIEESGVPCLSVIVPTYRTSPERLQNTELVKKAVRKAKLLLMHSPMPVGTREKMTERISDWSRSLDHVHALDGVGLFLSPGIAESVVFPFPVTETVVVDRSFITRDLFYLKQFVERYYILVLGHQSIRLLAAHADLIREVRDQHFPMHFEEEGSYEYERSAAGSSYGYGMKAFEKEKSELTAIRLKTKMKEADEYLSGYLKGASIELVLAGTTETLAMFEQITSHSRRIAGKVEGSFGWQSFEALRYLAWSAYGGHFKAKLHDLIIRLKETPPGNRSEGLRNVWKAVAEGKGLRLLVERNYRRRAYMREDSGQLYLRKPASDHVMIPDAVDEIVERVHVRKGKVFFVGDGELEEFGHIALVHRY